MKVSFSLRFAVALFLISIFPLFTIAQSGRNKTTSVKKNTSTQETPTQTPNTGNKETTENNNTEDTSNSSPVSKDDIVKVDTNLVLVPVIVSDRNNIYTPDLKQEEVEIYEDNVKQEIVFFGTVTQPFHVVLLLDTSGSTEEKLPMIKQAAFTFVTQLQKDDRVKVISFDDQILTLSEFTNDRNELRNAIYRTRPGNGTRLYDAMDTAIASFQKVEGRKAIVIFTDGVDMRSDFSSSTKNLEKLEEAGIIVYPIRFDTREELERIIRRQQQAGIPVDLNVLLGGGVPNGGGTPSTFPGGTTIPSKPQQTGPFPPVVITPPTTTTTRPNDPTRPYPNDSIDRELDMLYGMADSYLNDLSRISGGKLHRADTLGGLPAAFAKIADELRTQYSIGYYSSNKSKDGKFRKLKVKTTRKNVALRAKPGYRVPRES